jgi:hypothetical protein
VVHDRICADAIGLGEVLDQGSSLVVPLEGLKLVFPEPCLTTSGLLLLLGPSLGSKKQQVTELLECSAFVRVNPYKLHLPTWGERGRSDGAGQGPGQKEREPASGGPRVF